MLSKKIIQKKLNSIKKSILLLRPSYFGMPGLVSLISLCLPVFSTALINGQPLEKTPDLVRITFSNGWKCSGIFIDRFTILTAAHCLVSSGESISFKVDKILSANEETVPVESTKLVPHPLFSDQWWPTYDLGVIKTTENRNFQRQFQLEKKVSKSLGNILLMGAGKSDLAIERVSRTVGENFFFRLGSILFFFGTATDTDFQLGTNVSIAPQDSGGPIFDLKDHRIIGVMTTTTASWSTQYGLPVLNTGASAVTKSNLDFLLKQIESH